MAQSAIVPTAYADGAVTSGQGTVTVLPAAKSVARGHRWTARQRYTSW